MNLVNRLLSHPSERTALVTASGSWTYEQLGQRAARWRGGLIAAGVTGSDRVVVVGGNDEHFVLAQLATLGLGASLVPLNPLSPPAELAREVEVVAPAAVFMAPRSPVDWSQTASLLSGSAASIPLLDVEQLDAASPEPVVEVAGDTPAALLFTSGTAGMPKPAILTHANLDASLRSVGSLPLDLQSRHHVVLAVIPLFHVFGFNAIINLGMSIGATLVVEDYQGPDHLAELVLANEVTILGGPPNMWQSLAERPGLTAESFASVSLALSGAAKLPPEVKLAVDSRLGVDIDEGYGLTETCAMVSTSVDTEAPVGSVGRLLPGFEARLVDAEGADVLVGDPGELWVKGPMVSPGYFDLDGVVEREDEWLRTGDLAVVDDAGHLSIVDRVKDVVIVSGFNVYPGEVEAVLNAHDTIVQSAVVGADDPSTGETIVAYVVLADGATFDHEELTDYCRSQLARYKVPTRIEARQDLPVGIVGKLRRRELRSPIEE